MPRLGNYPTRQRPWQAGNVAPTTSEPSRGLRPSHLGRIIPRSGDISLSGFSRNVLNLSEIVDIHLMLQTSQKCLRRLPAGDRSDRPDGFKEVARMPRSTPGAETPRPA
jgi:hypothetical protein